MTTKKQNLFAAFLLTLLLPSGAIPAFGQADQNLAGIKPVGPENLGYFAQKIRDHHL